MWREIDYHLRLTALIHEGPLDPDLAGGDRAAG
jgi:hypothetical protein